MISRELALNSSRFDPECDVLSSSFAKVLDVSLFFPMKYFKILLLLALSIYFSGGLFLLFK